jgi:hypothetical protein
MTWTELTFSGLRRMWRTKEFGRIYSGLRKVKLRRRIKQRDKMADVSKKTEDNAKAGRGYSSGIRMREEEDDNNEDSEEPRKKKARTGRNNNGLTRQSNVQCKCGSKEHKQISSLNCPWKGL